MTTSTFNVSAFTYDGVTVPPDVMVDVLNDFEEFFKDFKEYGIFTAICDYYLFSDILLSYFDYSGVDNDELWEGFLDAFYEYLKNQGWEF